MNPHNTAIKDNPKDNRMRIVTVSILVFLGSLTASSVGWAQSSSCKQCSDQRRTCTANYSGPTCKTEYDRCMKDCQHK
jgi:hypothetical protein